MRIAGCGLLVLAFTSSAFAADHYVEVWNPPEARGGLHQARTTPKQVKRQHPAPHLVKTRAHQPATAKTKLTAKARAAHVGAPRVARDVPDVPRVTTSDGNVLRVGADGSAVRVAR
ncbi:hypothetical protein FAZ95_03155 [Trinickia violacea]|uniref:DUF4148 domain-containing protein n=1 Tax=Trinickia violacea TaxID=2571746 RepID=A0A4P8IL51_9BURK|nr:hypothetical protein [Trinickia violacea]QCP48275.1 hypothetical protein FAZ95_03155 [Trinickia violacea]